MTPVKGSHFDWDSDKWQKFLHYSLEQQNIAEFQEQLAKLTGRELYEMEFLSLMNRFLIDRPVSRAFRNAVLNYDVEPIDIMRNCMVDGFVFLKVEDKDSIHILQYVSKGEWDALDDKLMFVETKYVFFDESIREDRYHIEHWKRGPDDTGTWIVYKPIKDDKDDRTWAVQSTVNFPLFPIVGIRWVDAQSFLIPLKGAVIRLEAAYRTIGAENIERMGLSLYITGVRNVADIQTAPRKMGRRVHILPTGADFKSPSPDAPGMELMIHEINNLTTAIEKASGVVAAEKLATLSGISRSIAEEPLNALADELRKRFGEGMEEVWQLVRLMGGGAPEPLITYRPLKVIENKSEHVKILDRAVLLNAISPEEEIIELRLLLELSPTLESRIPVSSEERQRLQNKESENNDRRRNSGQSTGR